MHLGAALHKVEGTGILAALLSVSCGGAIVTGMPGGEVADATADVAAACDEVGASFSQSNNPNPPWSFGWRDDAGFHLYPDHRLYPDHDPALGTNVIIFWYTQQPNQLWNALGTVGKNPTNQVIQIGGTTTLQPGQLVMHPARQGQRAVVRWTARSAGAYQIEATFAGVAGDNGTSPTTTDVHVFVAAQEVFSDFINLNGRANSLTANTTSTLAATDTIEFRVGYGNANWTSDTTALVAMICAK